MKDELERYWDGYFEAAHRAIRSKDVVLVRMLDESLTHRGDVADVLRRWPANRSVHRRPRRPR